MRDVQRKTQELFGTKQSPRNRANHCNEACKEVINIKLLKKKFTHRLYVVS